MFVGAAETGLNKESNWLRFTVSRATRQGVCHDYSQVLPPQC